MAQDRGQIESYSAYKAVLERGVADLPSNDHRLAFALSCCERLLPNYAAFQRWARWGDLRSLKSALDALWLHLLGQTMPEARIAEIRAEIDYLTPDDDLDQVDKLPSSGCGMYSCCAIDEALKYLTQPIDMFILAVAQCAVETVDEQARSLNELENKYDSDFQKWRKGQLSTKEIKDILRARDNQLWLSTLIQREVSKQFADLDKLARCDQLSEDFIAGFRRSATFDGCSNLGYKIEPSDLTGAFRAACFDEATLERRKKYDFEPTVTTIYIKK